MWQLKRQSKSEAMRGKKATHSSDKLSGGVHACASP